MSERKIKFRGISERTGEFVYGSLFFADTGLTIIENGGSSQDDFHFVKPQTVGQFAIDENKEEIYGGDLFRQEQETENGDIRNYLVVTWIRQRGAFYMVPVEHYPILRDNDVSNEPEFDWLFQDAPLYDFSLDVGLKKVGTIHTHQHLYTSQKPSND